MSQAPLYVTRLSAKQSDAAEQHRPLVSNVPIVNMTCQVSSRLRNMSITPVTGFHSKLIFYNFGNWARIRILTRTEILIKE